MTRTSTNKETPMTATADASYATCPRCKWAGKLRKNGTMRKHRVAVDAGRIGSTGSLPQDPHGPVCKGSGEKPWEVGLPEGYELPKMNEHGGWQRAAETPKRKTPNLSALPKPQKADPETIAEIHGRRCQDCKGAGCPQCGYKGRHGNRHIVLNLGYVFAVRDTVTDLDVATSGSKDAAEAKAAELNESDDSTGDSRVGDEHEAAQDPGPSLDDYAKASRIIQSLIPGVRR